MRCALFLLRATPILTCLSFASAASATETVIDDFSSPTSLMPWMFSAAGGATGSLTSGPGEMGAGAALNFNFPGNYQTVEMSLTLPKPLTAVALGYSAEGVGARTQLAIVDSSGQTLHYGPNRPFASPDPNAWFDIVVDLSAPRSYSGGDNNGVVHQPITALSLSVYGDIQGGRSGVMGFDNVVAWDSMPLTLDPDQPPLPAPTGSAELANRIGIATHQTDDATLGLIADAGFTRVRVDFLWQNVETTKKSYSLTRFTDLQSALAGQGLSMLLIFDYMNTLYPSATQAGFDSMTVPALAAAAKATATALKGTGVSYEVWNEENGGDFNVDGGVAEYAALSAAVIAAVHEADPSALVTTGGLATPPLGTLDDAFLKAMLAAGAGAGANAIGIHPYRQGGAESVTDDLALANATVAEALPSAPPIWDTEWGYSSEWYGDAGGATPASRELQAQRVSRELLTVWAVGFPVAMYYDTRDDGTDATDQEDNFGLLLPDSTAKPAMVAVQTLTRLAKGRTFAGFLNMGFTSMHAMLLTGSSDRLVALWSDAPGSVTQVAVPATAAVTDFLGNAVAVTADGGATNVTVSEVAGPLFLTFPNPPPATTDAGVDASIRDASLDLDASRDAAHDAMPAEFLPASSKSGCGCKVAGAPERDRSWFALASFALIGLAARIRGRDVGVDAGPGGGRPPWAR